MTATDTAAQLDALAVFTRMKLLNDAATLIRKQDATIKALNALKPLELVPDPAKQEPSYSQEISWAFSANKLANEMEPE